jgi:hypothetical protein
MRRKRTFDRERIYHHDQSRMEETIDTVQSMYRCACSPDIHEERGGYKWGAVDYVCKTHLRCELSIGPYVRICYRSSLVDALLSYRCNLPWNRGQSMTI